MTEDAASTAGPPTPAAGQAGDLPPGTWGPYRILGKLGEGGFGAVYRARQLEPVRRDVALKVLKPGVSSPEIVARFEAERQALALMDHPGIATVLDAGVGPGGLPWFAMELLDGVPLTDYCDRQRLDLAARLRLFEEVCLAVQHAHQKGVIHRDLKPSNILVTQRDGVARPVVIDFGIAKAIGPSLTDASLVTQSFQILGTPEYMAPEQAGGRPGDVDTRADVYALGVLLYELVTGTKPFLLRTLVMQGLQEILRVIREVEPPRPSTRVQSLGAEGERLAGERGCTPPVLARELRGDLDWIVMKAIEKERGRRYDGVGDLVQDLRRHLAHEPVSASPPSRLYRLRKLVRRHRGGVAAAVAITLLLIAGATGTGVGLLRARASAEEARLEAGRSARVSDLMQSLLEGVRPQVALGRDTTLLLALLDQTRARVDLARAAAQTRVDDEVEYALRRVLAEAYLGIRALPEARAQADRAVDLAHGLFGATQARTAAAVVQHAAVLYEQGQFAEAAAALPAAIEVLEQSPPGSAALPSAWIELGNDLRELSRFDEAARAFGQALELSAADPDLAHLEANAAINLGKLHDKLGEAAEFLRRQEQALAIYRRLHAGDQPELANAITGVGRAHLALGNREQAEAHLLEGLAMSRRLFAPTHPTLAAQVHNLARFYKSERRWEQAEPLYREVVAIDRANDPAGSRSLVNSLLNLGVLYRAMGRLDQAGEQLAASFEMRERLGLEPDLDHGIALNSLGLYLEEAGRPAEAAAILQRSVGLLEGFLGPAHASPAQARYFVGRTRLAAGEFEAAAIAAERSVESLTAAFGAGHYTTLEARSLVAEIDLARGRPEAAVCGFRLALAERQAALPPTHASIAKNELDLGRALLAAGRLAEAGPPLHSAWERVSADGKATPAAVTRYAQTLAEFHESCGEPAVAAQWRARAEEAGG